MGRRWPTDPDDASYRRQPRLQLQRLRQDHRRARRTRSHHALRLPRRPAPGQPPAQCRWHPAEVPLRQRAAVAHGNRKRIRRAISAGLHRRRIDPTGNRLRRPTHGLRLRPQWPVAGENRVRR
nr:hypothetical protein [Pseudomonas arsenicoxydans]